MGRTRLIFRELKNYFFLRKVLARESSVRTGDPEKRGSASWLKHGLRKNWYGRIYTVVSLREEDMGEEEMVRNWKAMELMRPINDYLTDIGLQEIVFPSIEAIPDSRSYLVVYSPLFKELTIMWVIWRVFFLLAVGAAIYVFT